MADGVHRPVHDDEAVQHDALTDKQLIAAFDEASCTEYMCQLPRGSFHDAACARPPEKRQRAYDEEERQHICYDDKQHSVPFAGRADSLDDTGANKDYIQHVPSDDEDDGFD